MVNYDLPTSVEINGVPFEIQSDFRAALDICAAFSDPELDGQGRTLVALKIFYPDFKRIRPEDYQEAIDKCVWFLNARQEDAGQKRPKLMDWEQDFQYVIAPINRVIGQEVRAMPYLHYWTFMSAYMEIGGDCTFAQIVAIRDKRSRGKKLEKHEKEWLNRNRHLVDFKRKYTEADDEFLKQWIR